MQDNYENTKEISVDDLIPDEKESKKKSAKKQSSAKSSTTKKNKGKTKKGKTSKKFKPIYLVPILFIVVVLLVGISVWQASRQDGPVYGNRCDGMAAISEAAITQTVSEMKSENSDITDLTITINCKTLKIDMTMNEDADEDETKQACQDILLKLDEKVGLTKSNSESAYSDLFGTSNGKTQYHVDFTIKGNGDIFPIFASKHPASDDINYTLNIARDPDLVDKLHEQQDGEKAAE